MELSKYAKIDLVAGKVIFQAEYPLAEAVVPTLELVKAKIESGEIDLIKGTDLDKDLALKVLNALIVIIK